MNAIPPVLLAVGLAFAGPALAQNVKDQVAFAIARTRLPDALTQWSEVTGLQVISQAEVLRDLTANPVVGSYTPMDALRMLLANTSLTFTTVGNNTVSIEPIGKNVTTRRAAPQLQRLAAGQTAETAARLSSEPSAARQVASTERPFREEIVVTAQKRVERLQDVPVPVTAISADRLAEKNQVLLRDYFTSVPGLDVMPSIQSQQTLSIRGVTTGTGNPTVAVVIDDVPYGSSTNIGGGRAVPDIDPGDLARIEVLRGPQGTLYGASSLGGLLKFVTRDPSPEALQGRVQVGATSISESDEIGYSVRGSVNVPLSATAAIRASGFTRQDPGIVDNVQSGEKDVDSADAKGGRLSALWRVADRFSVKLSALLQETDGDGATSADRILGEMKQSRLRGSGGFKRNVEAYSAIANIQLGRAELVSLTGYNVNSYDDSLDLSYLLSGQAQANFNVPGATLVSANETEKVSQEFRLSAPLGAQLEWTLAAFYSNEDSDLLDSRYAIDPATGAAVGRLLYSTILSSFEEYAASASLTYHVTERFDVQVGGRQSEIEQTFEQNSINVAGLTSTIPEVTRKTDAFTYLLTPRWKVSDDLMMYARFASGYRAGGINPFPGGIVPPVYEPDKTQNYELGLKGEFLDGALTLDASVYHIDWKDIQLLLISPNAFSYSTNGSEAKSQGIELAFEANPMGGFTASGWIAWNNSELTERLPLGAPGTAVGQSGERLPNSSRISGSLSLDYEFSLTSTWDGFMGATGTHMGDRLGPFLSIPQREHFASYNRFDLRGGVRTDTWLASVFVNNVADERGALYGGLGANPPTAYTYIPTRTVGLSVTRSF